MAIETLFLLIFSAYTLFFHLGNEPFLDYDEATYAEVTRESLLQGNPTQLTYLNQPYFRKPPLLFWMTTASTRIFEDPEFAARFPSSLAAFATAVLVALVCVEAGAGMPVVLFGAVVLATTSGWIEFARDVRFDNLVSCFVLASLYAGMRAARDPRWYRIVGIALALAVLSKNVIAVFGAIAVATYLFFAKGLRGALYEFRTPQLWQGVALFFLIAAPWHIYESVHYGAAFWQSYFGTEVLERAGTNLFQGGTNPTNAEYLQYVFQFGAPWVEVGLVLLIGLSWYGKEMSTRLQRALWAALISAAAVVFVMFTAKTKAYGYLMPLFPFLAVSVALMVEGAWNWLNEHAAPRARTVFVFALGFLTLFAAFHLNPYFSTELSTAQEEYTVARIIRATPQPVVYTYGVTRLGSIMYYSGLPQTPAQFVFPFTSQSKLDTSSTNFLLATTTLPELQRTFPHHQFTKRYTGSFVSLFAVSN